MQHRDCATGDQYVLSRKVENKVKTKNISAACATDRRFELRRKVKNKDKNKVKTKMSVAMELSA